MLKASSRVLTSSDLQTRLSTITALYEACDIKFNQVLSIIQEPGNDIILSVKHLISDHYDRFILWAGNLGVKLSASSQASLDWRLRDAPDMKDAIASLLRELHDAIEDLVLIITGNRENRTIEVPDEQIADGSTRPVPESSELIGIVGDSISGLFHLSMVIQRATPQDRFKKAVAAKEGTIDASYDIRHVAQKFAKLDGDQQQWLCEKLGIASSHRRLFFSYCRDHHEQLAENSIADKATIAQTTASTLKLDLLPTSTRDMIEPEGDDISQTSFASSVNDGADDGRLHVPHLNKVHDTLEAFQCPYCFKIINPSSHRYWKKHVFNDLRPYTCTSRGCTLLPFASRSAWFDHEVSEHHSTFQCMFCKHAPHHSGDALSRHMSEKHAKACPPSAIPSLVKASTVQPSRFSSEKCPFCNDWASQLRILNPHISKNQDISVTAKQYRNHVASHLEQLALFTLPKLYNDDESEYNDEGEYQDSNEAHDDDNPTMQDTYGSRALEGAELLADSHRYASQHITSQSSRGPSEPPLEQGPAHRPKFQVPSQPDTKAEQQAAELQRLTNLFNTVYKPQCEAFIRSPPKENDARSKEHSRLAETIIAKIMLNAEDIVAEDDPNLRQEGRSFIVDIKTTLTRVDKALTRSTADLPESEDELVKLESLDGDGSQL